MVFIYIFYERRRLYWMHVCSCLINYFCHPCIWYTVLKIKHLYSHLLITPVFIIIRIFYICVHIPLSPLTSLIHNHTCDRQWTWTVHNQMLIPPLFIVICIMNISNAISSTDFILGTKVQPNKAQSLTQVSMILTLGQGQGHRSRSRSQVKVKFPPNG